jgi:hypothetical protein
LDTVYPSINRHLAVDSCVGTLIYLHSMYGESARAHFALNCNRRDLGVHGRVHMGKMLLLRDRATHSSTRRLDTSSILPRKLDCRAHLLHSMYINVKRKPESWMVKLRSVRVVSLAIDSASHSSIFVAKKKVYHGVRTRAAQRSRVHKTFIQG